MEGLLQLLLYGFIYWLIMGRRKKKKRPGAAPDQPAKPAAPRVPAMEPARQRPASSRPERPVETVPPIDEEAPYDPFEELRGALMQEGRAEEKGLRPSRDRSPDLRGRLENVREQREESRRRELAEKRRAERAERAELAERAERAEREARASAEVVSFEVPVVPDRTGRRPLPKPRTAGKRESRRRSVLRNLRDPGSLRAAIILTEVLGPPLAKRGPRNAFPSR
ncbi:MAG: hypothetical protein HKN20_01425 [Gemmatimonadetes bacterium]|nr:hypothetical protein [Gemmatimonadota bacterium]